MDQSYMDRAYHESVEVAGRILEEKLAEDRRFPSLIELTGLSGQNLSNNPTESGLHDYDYPAVSSVSGNLVDVKELVSVNRIPLPPEVMEQFSHMECNCMMGLFPEIHRAWLTIDSDIYMWTYERETDVAYFDGLKETIVSVGLVQPKTGIFEPFVKYLLVLTTSTEIVILGVRFAKKKYDVSNYIEELILMRDLIFVVPTEGVSINTVAGTDTGRIFLGGRDGSLFEIYYQAKSSWFSKRCKKVNHSTSSLSFLMPQFLKFSWGEEEGIIQISIDNSRHILYTLTDRGTISVFDLGEDGESCYKVLSHPQIKTVRRAFQAVPTLDGNVFRPITSISAIEKSESREFNLLAVAETGVRFYFTTRPDQYDSGRPYELELLHVRLPPGFAANAPATRPSNVHLAHYRKGNTLLVSTPASDNDVVWCLSNDLYLRFPFFVESHAIIQLSATVWAMAEIDRHDMHSLLKCVNAPEHLLQIPAPIQQQQSGSSPQPSPQSSQYAQFQQQGQQQQIQQHENIRLLDPPSVVRQHMETPKKYALLTPQGVEIVMKLRPVDVLKQIMVESGGPDTEAVKNYFRHLQEDQACATCLILACMESSQNKQISEWATRAFFRYGGEPKIGMPPNPATYQQTYSSGFNPTAISTPVHNSLQSQPSVSLSGDLSAVNVQYSAKHNGLYLYLGRILRPLWYLKVVERIMIEHNAEVFSSTIPREDCIFFLGHLHALRSFLEKNTTFSSTGLSNALLQTQRMQDSFDGQTPSQRTSLRNAQLKEKTSLDSLKVFVSHTCEVLGLWKILLEHQFYEITNSLTMDLQHQLSGMTFGNFIVLGYDLRSALIKNLINRYLSDDASVDSISSKLREVCPTLYRNEDAVCSKANEYLLTAKNVTNKEDKEDKLKSALDLCCKVAPNINLPYMCQWFTSLQYYQGVLELSLVCAKRRDPNNIALHFYKNDQPAEDREGFQAYANRMDCYKELTVVLDQLYNQSLSSPLSPSIPATPGPPVKKEVSQITPSEAGQQVMNLVSLILQSDDELFHVAVYEWMLNKGLHSELIRVNCPSLEMFLTKTTKRSPGLTYLYDILWKYHEMNKNYAAAAKILFELATKESPSINLAQRIDYLARAIVSLRCDGAGYAPHHGLFLKDLEDKRDVAYIQQEVLDAIGDMVRPGVEEAVARLNSSLLDITTLYVDYAEPFGLWTVKLDIIHCSGHVDDGLVENIWLHIINDELCKCGLISGEEKMAVLMNHVKFIGEKCSRSPRTFPLAFLIKNLELQNCRLGGNPSQVHAAFTSIGVPLINLFSIYNELLAANDRCWYNEGDQLHLIKVIADMISRFVNNSTMVQRTERRVALSKAGDMIIDCLTIVRSLPDTEELVSILREIQLKLNRMT